jgi:NTE family protein
MVDTQPVSPEITEQVESVVAEWQATKQVDLVFQGGGVLGIGLVGAYSVLHQEGYRPENLAGTSAGAIVATLIAAGFTPLELFDTIFALDFRRFMDPTPIGRLPLVGNTALGALGSVLVYHGLFAGNYFRAEMQRQLNRKQVRTFRQLRLTDDPNTRPEYQHKVQVITSDVTERRLLRLPMDARLLGTTPDEFSVANAVRMSTSIPLFFQPVHCPPGRSAHVLVDGGMLSNFPIWLFDSPPGEIPPWPTFGIRLVDQSQREPVLPAASRPRVLSLGRLELPLKPGGLADFAWSLVETMTQFHDRLYLDTDTFARTINVPTLGLSGTAFDLTQQQKQALYDSGVRAAEEFLRRWNFREYILNFRVGTSPGRSAILKEWMARRTPAQAGGAGTTAPSPRTD